jgi:hypothetical protein
METVFIMQPLTAAMIGLRTMVISCQLKKKHSRP